MRRLSIVMLATCLLPSGCGKTSESPAAEGGQAQAQAAPSEARVGYDLRRLRPRNGEPLETMFERLRKQAVAEGKTVAVLFSAGWCEPCQHLALEFGNRHPASSIGHVRIFELEEEDWEAVTRMDEFNALRSRWHATLNSYPVFLILDEKGQKIDEMKEAIERLERRGIDPTLPHWFRELRAG